jgi:hypothetical protein
VGVVRCEMNLRLVWGGRKKVVRWQLDCVGILLLIVEEINGERVYIYIYWKQNANCRISMQHEQIQVDILHSASSAPLILVSLHSLHTKILKKIEGRVGIVFGLSKSSIRSDPSPRTTTPWFLSVGFVFVFI